MDPRLTVVHRPLSGATVVATCDIPAGDGIMKVAWTDGVLDSTMAASQLVEWLQRQQQEQQPNTRCDGHDDSSASIVNRKQATSSTVCRAAADALRLTTSLETSKAHVGASAEEVAWRQLGMARASKHADVALATVLLRWGCRRISSLNTSSSSGSTAVPSSDTTRGEDGRLSDRAHDRYSWIHDVVASCGSDLGIPLALPRAKTVMGGVAEPGTENDDWFGSTMALALPSQLTVSLEGDDTNKDAAAAVLTCGDCHEDRHHDSLRLDAVASAASRRCVVSSASPSPFVQALVGDRQRVLQWWAFCAAYGVITPSLFSPPPPSIPSVTVMDDAVAATLGDAAVVPGIEYDAHAWDASANATRTTTNKSMIPSAHSFLRYVAWIRSRWVSCSVDAAHLRLAMPPQHPPPSLMPTPSACPIDRLRDSCMGGAGAGGTLESPGPMTQSKKGNHAITGDDAGGSGGNPKRKKKKKSSSTAATSGGATVEVFAVVPIVEKLNHNPHSLMHPTVDWGVAVTLEAARLSQQQQKHNSVLACAYNGLTAGSEVLINYGPLCNAKLLSRYGFVLEKDCPSEVVEVQLPRVADGVLDVWHARDTAVGTWTLRPPLLNLHVGAATPSAVSARYEIHEDDPLSVVSPSATTATTASTTSLVIALPWNVRLTLLLAAHGAHSGVLTLAQAIAPHAWPPACSDSDSDAGGGGGSIFSEVGGAGGGWDDAAIRRLFHDPRMQGYAAQVAQYAREVLTLHAVELERALHAANGLCSHRTEQTQHDNASPPAAASTAAVPLSESGSHSACPLIFMWAGRLAKEQLQLVAMAIHGVGAAETTRTVTPHQVRER